MERIRSAEAWGIFLPRDIGKILAEALQSAVTTGFLYILREWHSGQSVQVFHFTAAYDRGSLDTQSHKAVKLGSGRSWPFLARGRRRWSRGQWWPSSSFDERLSSVHGRPGGPIPRHQHPPHAGGGIQGGRRCRAPDAPSADEFTVIREVQVCAIQKLGADRLKGCNQDPRLCRRPRVDATPRLRPSVPLVGAP